MADSHPSRCDKAGRQPKAHAPKLKGRPSRTGRRSALSDAGADESLARAQIAWQICADILAQNASLNRATLTQMCQRLVHEAGFSLAWVGLIETQRQDGGLGQQIRPVAQCGFDPGYLKLSDALPAALPAFPGPTTEAILTGTMLVRNSLFGGTRDERQNGHAGDSDAFGSMLAMPLKQRQRCLGVLTLVASQAAAFPPPVVKLLGRIARKLAQAMKTMAPGLNPDLPG